MRVAVNLNMFHPELPLLQRYKIAAAAGFRQVEVSLPYSEKAEDLKSTADSLGLTHTLINAPTEQVCDECECVHSQLVEVMRSKVKRLKTQELPGRLDVIESLLGDWSRGFRGLAALSSCKTEFRESVDTAIHYAKTLKCDKIHVMAGIPTGSEQDVPKLFIDNVAYAAEKFGKADIMCLIEPINHYTVPGYFLSSYEQAKEVIDAVKLPNLKIQYDVFHAQQICGQISATIKKYKELIGYIQIAQVPSRDEPNTPGEVDYQYVLRQLQSANPNWTIGLEHNFNEAHGSPRDWVKQLGLSM